MRVFLLGLVAAAGLMLLASPAVADVTLSFQGSDEINESMGDITGLGTISLTSYDITTMSGTETRWSLTGSDIRLEAFEALGTGLNAFLGIPTLEGSLSDAKFSFALDGGVKFGNNYVFDIAEITPPAFPLGPPNYIEMTADTVGAPGEDAGTVYSSPDFSALEGWFENGLLFYDGETFEFNSNGKDTKDGGMLNAFGIVTDPPPSWDFQTITFGGKILSTGDMVVTSADIRNVSTNADIFIPEPSSMALLSIGVISGVVAGRRRRRGKQRAV